MNRHTPLLTLATLMVAATTAFAQGAAPGGGAGAGSQGQGAVANDAGIPGWSTMSAEERGLHRQRMQSFRTRDDCSRYMAQLRTRGGKAAGPVEGGNAVGGPSGTGPSAGTAPGGNDPCGHLPRS